MKQVDVSESVNLLKTHMIHFTRPLILYIVNYNAIKL